MNIGSDSCRLSFMRSIDDFQIGDDFMSENDRQRWGRQNFLVWYSCHTQISNPINTKPRIDREIPEKIILFNQIRQQYSRWNDEMDLKSYETQITAILLNALCVFLFFSDPSSESQQNLNKQKFFVLENLSNIFQHLIHL